MPVNLSDVERSQYVLHTTINRDQKMEVSLLNCPEVGILIISRNASQDEQDKAKNNLLLAVQSKMASADWYAASLLANSAECVSSCLSIYNRYFSEGQPQSVRSYFINNFCYSIKNPLYVDLLIKLYVRCCVKLNGSQIFQDIRSRAGVFSQLIFYPHFVAMARNHIDLMKKLRLRDPFVVGFTLEHRPVQVMEPRTWPCSVQ